MMIIEQIPGLSLDSNGIWNSKVLDTISYVEDGHSLIAASEDSSFWYQHRLNIIEKSLEDFKVRELLDVGGGNGMISKFLQDKDLNIVLIEPGVSGALQAKNSGVKNVINASFTELEISEGAVEAMGLFDVLEHIEDDEAFLRKSYRTLTENGKLFLTVPALQMLYSDFDRQVGHYRRYTLRDLSKKLKRAGFKLEYNSYLFFPLPVLIWLLRKVFRITHRTKKKHTYGHVDKRNLLGKLISFYLSMELKLFSSRIKIPFGSTCVVVASKVS